MSSALTELNRPPSTTAYLPSRKRLILEPDQDFFGDDEPTSAAFPIAMEEEEEQPPSDLEEEEDQAALEAQRERDQLVASSSTSLETASIDAFSSSKGSNRGTGSGNDAKGKSRMMSFEEDQEFGDEEFEFTQTTTTSTRVRKPLIGEDYDYTSKYGSINSLNLQQQSTSSENEYSSNNGWLEQVPVEATRLDGTKLTFRRKKRLELTQIGLNKSSGEDPKELAKLAQSSLEKPFQQMVQSIETDLLMQKKQRQADATSAAFGSTSNGINNNNGTDEKDKIVETQLWTDRYRPKKFTDLLGDERVHRSALSWLKEWDNCVFKGRNNNNNNLGSTRGGGAAGAIKKERRNAKRGREGNTFGGGGTGGGGFAEEIAPDPYGRPHEKILLLSGPPGLGKTTLAHVLARQAGYQVHEVNASDDRTSRVVEERIRNALDSTSLSLGWSEKEKRLDNNGNGGGGGGARPTCVVVDEIDGAANGGDSSFIKTLVKLVTEGSSTKKPLKRKNGTKGKKDRPLLRPIICICNDLYAPVLRPLRPLAKTIRFQPPTNTMLTKRLRTICEMESMKAENKHLTLLVETAQGDLRSCLNTLQFIKRKGDVVDEKAIRSTSLGMKDTGTSSIQVLDRLFKKPSRKKGVSTDDRYITRIVRDVQTSGEYEKIAQGCFENYLLARDTDNEAFPRISEALDWLYFFDRLDGKLRTDRDYELLGYVPYSFVPWYPLFSSQTPNPVELPKTDYEMYLQRTAHDEIATTFSLNLPLSLKSTFTATTLVSELLPLFNRIVSPDLKPINSQVVKNEERQKLMRTVNTLILMKTGFVIDKNEEGQLSYKLDPPIDVFVHYEGKRATDIAPGRYAVRQMITREVDAELLRRGNENEGTTRDASDILSAYKTKPAAATIAPEVKQAVDFFGRAIVAKPLTASQEAAALLAPPPPKKVKQTMYKFNEGFSNAVRTTKRVSDFFA